MRGPNANGFESQWNIGLRHPCSRFSKALPCTLDLYPDQLVVAIPQSGGSLTHLLFSLVWPLLTHMSAEFPWAPRNVREKKGTGL